MGAQKGKDLLLKIDRRRGYVTVAGLRSRRIAFNAELVDITHAESADRWRELWPAPACAAPRSPAAGCSRTPPPTRWCGRRSSTG